MEEKKYKLGSVLIADKSTSEVEIVSCFQGTFKGDRRVTVLKTEMDTYVIETRKPDENGEMITHSMHLTKESFAALITSIHLFLEEEKEDVRGIVESCMDENTAYLYKTNKDEEEETV